jgi:hypothetical protein
MDVPRPVNPTHHPFDVPPDHTPVRTTASVNPAVLRRVKSEFEEMRGFSPTLLQAARLFDLSADECRRVLESLVDQGVLQTTPDGCYRLMSAE